MVKSMKTSRHSATVAQSDSVSAKTQEKSFAKPTVQVWSVMSSPKPKLQSCATEKMMTVMEASTRVSSDHALQAQQVAQKMQTELTPVKGFANQEPKPVTLESGGVAKINRPTKARSPVMDRTMIVMEELMR
tara:strand:- start:14275 stop:14670 length:396 start_codon:yes stop_codon:yes gene_type:complete